MRIPFVLAACLFACSLSARAADRPNFVWLISEDNSKHFLRLFDSTGASTPSIEALAKHGLVFENAFSNAPVCSVARTTLMTSCYAPRVGTQYHRRAKLVPMPDGLHMFPKYLHDAGYYTTNRQKEDYNAIKGPDVWDESSRKASWRQRQGGQPFFHMQSFGTTHEGQLHFSEKKMRSEKTETDPKTVFVPPHHPDTPTFRYTYARYHDRIRAVDAQIGSVVKQLEEDGLLADTFVFYFGDHGGVLPRGKGYAYETGLHVPLVVRVPENFRRTVDAKVGTRVRGFVSFVDFGPTLLNLAGLEVPDGVDGRAFLGKGVRLDELNSRDEAFGYADRFDEKYDFVRTLRKGRFKYMRSYQPFNFDGLQNNYRYRMLAYREWRELHQAGKLDAVRSQFFEVRAPEALYDLESDPYETKNIAADPAHAETLTALRSRLQEIVRGMPDLSFFPESYLVEEAFDNPVRFGRERKAEISDLVRIADLSLEKFVPASKEIGRALRSTDRWQRYWGLIVCSSFGKQCRSFTELVKKIAADDPDQLVRVRAAEYLGLNKLADPRPVMLDALSKTPSAVEACLMLNTLILLRDGPAAWELDVSKIRVVRTKQPRGNVNRRLSYLRQ